MSDKDRVCVGAIAGPHGVRGQVKVVSFTARPKDVAAYGEVSNEKATETFKIKVVGTAAKGRLIVTLEGVADRNRAEELKGEKLYVPRGALPEPEEDEFYHADLIGLAVQSLGGDDLGVIRTVANHGAGDILEVERGDGEVELVPFTKAVVPVVDLSGQKVIVDPPEGQFEAKRGEKDDQDESQKDGKDVR